MSSPVLDGARIVPAKSWRYDLTASMPMNAPANDRAAPPRLVAQSDEHEVREKHEWHQAREVADREKWRRMGQAEVLGVAAHHGLRDGQNQIDLFLSSNSMLGLGGKHRLADKGTVALALGAHMHMTIFSLLFKDDDQTEDDEGFPTIMKLSLPLWIGIEPDPWLSVYLNVRSQLWWVEPVGVTGALAHTAGFRFGKTFGVIAEATYTYEPFYQSSGFQTAFALYLSTDP